LEISNKTSSFAISFWVKEKQKKSLKLNGNGTAPQDDASYHFQQLPFLAKVS